MRGGDGPTLQVHNMKGEGSGINDINYGINNMGTSYSIEAIQTWCGF